MPLNNDSEVANIYKLNADVLVDTLSTMRETFESGTTEFALISILKQPPYAFFNENALRDPLMLFRTHFVLFHALYRLREHWREEGVGELSIHTLNIKCHASTPQTDETSGSSSSLQERDPLAAYYLTWSNFQQTDVQEVESLLNDFWQKMISDEPTQYTQDEIDKAHATLGMHGVDNESMPLTTLKKQYKKALLKAHPDKGGSQKCAQKVIRAFQMLRQYYSLPTTSNVTDR